MCKYFKNSKRKNTYFLNFKFTEIFNFHFESFSKYLDLTKYYEKQLRGQIKILKYFKKKIIFFNIRFYKI